ncbi:MAG: alpha/beta hydrolase family esterase, partial [Gammaproteobacteria bacterium]
MKTQLLSFMQKHTSDGLTFRASETQQAAVVGPPSLPVRNNLVRYLAGFLLVGAAVLGHMSPAHANHIVAPFGIHCDSVGPDGTAYVPGVNCRVMAVDGYSRRYVVWVPLAGVPANSPAVFMLHGASGTGERFLRMSGWREKATQEGFVAIFPTAVEHFGLDKQRFSTVWNTYGLPAQIDPNQRPAGYPATSPWPADDVTFIRQIGDDVIQQLSTDPMHIHVAGFSSGGAMCARLGVEASDLIASVACHTSGFDEVHETLVGHRNLSAYFSIGTLDGKGLEAINSYLIALGQPTITELPLDPADLDQIPPIKNKILVTLDSFNLEAIPVTTLTGATWTELHAQTPQPGNIDGNELYFAFLEDVTHQYPNGTNNPLGFNLPDRVWPF